MDPRNEQALFTAAKASAQPLGDHRALLRANGNRMIVDGGAAVARLISLLDGARTLRDHAQRLQVLGLGDNAASARETVEAMVQIGLLEPVAMPAREEQDAASPIGTIGIITADRPRMLARCLSDATTHLRHFDRRTRIIVVDGSQREDSRRRNEAACRHACADQAVTYVSQNAREGAVRQLSRLGLDRRALAGSLTSGHFGSNRNVLQLLTAGEPLLMVDDDVRWLTWRAADANPVPAFVQGAGSPDVRFWYDSRRSGRGSYSHDYRSAGSARGIAGEERLDSVPGGCGSERRLSVRVAPSRIERADACPLDAGWSRRGFRLAVRVPSSARTDLGRHVSSSDPAVLARALSSREVQRVASRPAITRDASCMTLCTAVDNAELTPPFMPMGRNEDGMFAAMLAVTDTRALFGHLPVGIVHDSHRPSARLPDDLPSARESRFADLAMTIVEIAAGLPPPESVGHGLRRLSQVAHNVAGLPHADFVEFLTQVFLTGKGRTITRIEELLALPASDSWRAAAERYRDALLTTIVSPDLCRIVEFSALPVNDAVRACATTLHAWGEILGAWNEIWQHAREHKEELFIECRGPAVSLAPRRLPAVECAGR